MTGLLLAGVMLIAFGPPAVLLLGYASRRAALLIVTITSAFFWLFSVFITSIVWIAIPPLQQTHPFIQVIGILFQEAVRMLLIYVYAKAEFAADKLLRQNGPKLFNDFSTGIAAGLGFGCMHTVMMYGAVLATASSEAAFYIDSCPHINMYTWSAVAALLYNVLHIALMIVAIDAFRRRNYWLVSVPFIAHLAFGLITLLNAAKNGCEASLGIMGAIAVLCCVLVWWIERVPDYAAKRQVRAWEILAADRQPTSIASASRSISGRQR